MKIRCPIVVLLSGVLLILLQTIRAQIPAAQAEHPPVSSQQPAAQDAAAKKVDPAKKADILRLMDLMGTKKVMSQVIPMMAAQVRTNISSEQSLDERANRAFDLTMARVQARVDSGAYEDLYVSLYDKYFTIEDIRQMIQFYESSVGQKLVQTLPQITRDAMGVTSAWMQEDMAAVRTEMDSTTPARPGPPKKSPANP